MNIWIISEYTSIPDTGNSIIRHKHFAEHLRKMGHFVSVICARNHHLNQDIDAARRGKRIFKLNNVDYIRINTINYINSNSYVRVINMFIFAMGVLRTPLIKNRKPDIILVSTPSQICFLSSMFLRRIYNAKIVLEIRDLWPLTLQAIGGYSKWNPLIIILKIIEKISYLKADFIISNLEGAYEYLKKFGIKRNKFAWIPNGISKKELDQYNNSKYNQLDNLFLKQIPIKSFIVCYAGSMNTGNYLQTLIEVANELINSNIHFLLIGDGTEKKELLELANSKQNKNITFTGRVDKKTVHQILKRVDICIQSSRRSKIYEFGSASIKICEYLYAKKPVLHCYSGKYSIIDKYKLGTVVQSENKYQLKEAILKLSKMPNNYLQQIGERGNKIVLNNFEYRKLTKKLELELLKLYK